MPDDSFAMVTRRAGNDVVVELKGELDVGGADRLRAELRTVLVSSVDRLEIDAEGLTFVDSAGLHALVVASEEAETRGITFRVTAVSPLVKRVIDVSGLGKVLLPGHEG